MGFVDVGMLRNVLDCGKFRYFRSTIYLLSILKKLKINHIKLNTVKPSADNEVVQEVYKPNVQ